MTNPQQPAQTRAEELAAAAEEQAVATDAGSLTPTLLAILATYLGYRAGKGAVKNATVDTAGKLTGTSARIAAQLGLPERIGAALALIANRAVNRQARRARRTDGTRDPEAILAYALAEPVAVDAAVKAGQRLIAETARSWSRQARTAPPDEPPPTEDEVRAKVAELAETTAHVTANAAIAAAAAEAGWRRAWHSRGDNRVRMTHAFLGSKGYESHIVDGTDPFVSPSGAHLRFPGDPAAPIEETANCRCWQITYPNPNAAGKAGVTRQYASDAARRQHEQFLADNRRYVRDLAAYRQAMAAWESKPPVLGKHKPQGPPQRPKPFVLPKVAAG